MDTRLRILQEAGMLFSKYGIRSVTMDSIANELGISKRTLYEIFTDKDDLVMQAIQEGSKHHKKVCRKIISESDNVIDAIFKIFTLNNETFGKMNPLFFEDLKKYHSQIFKQIQQKGDIRDYKLTEKLLERGASEGIFDDNLDFRIINLFVHKLVDLLHETEFEDFSKNEIGKSVIIPYLLGISTKTGRDLIDKYLENYNN
mgnify:CR=1 FL=1